MFATLSCNRGRNAEVKLLPGSVESFGGRRPSRLACIECRARKMKCTGVKSGCSRCLANGIPCVYPASSERCRPRRKRTDTPTAPKESTTDSSTNDSHSHRTSLSRTDSTTGFSVFEATEPTRAKPDANGQLSPDTIPRTSPYQSSNQNACQNTPPLPLPQHSLPMAGIGNPSGLPSPPPPSGPKTPRIGGFLPSFSPMAFDPSLLPSSDIGNCVRVEDADFLRMVLETECGDLLSPWIAEGEAKLDFQPRPDHPFQHLNFPDVDRLEVADSYPRSNDINQFLHEHLRPDVGSVSEPHSGLSIRPTSRCTACSETEVLAAPQNPDDLQASLQANRCFPCSCSMLAISLLENLAQRDLGNGGLCTDTVLKNIKGSLDQLAGWLACRACAAPKAVAMVCALIVDRLSIYLEHGVAHYKHKLQRAMEQDKDASARAGIVGDYPIESTNEWIRIMGVLLQIKTEEMADAIARLSARPGVGEILHGADQRVRGILHDLASRRGDGRI